MAGRAIRAARLLLLGLASLGAQGCELLPRAPLAELEPAQTLPEPPGSYLELGRQYLGQGQIDLAHDAFVRSLRVEGTSAAALSGAGIAAERQGLLTAARRHFERAVALAPDSQIAHNNLGAVLYRLGEYPAAQQAFQAAFALSSGTNRIAAHNLGLAGLAIARAEREEVPLAPNPVSLQRTGTGEYTLFRTAGEPTGGAEGGELDG